MLSALMAPRTAADSLTKQATGRKVKYPFKYSRNVIEVFEVIDLLSDTFQYCLHNHL